jgi:hypothetical protein
MDEQTTRTIGPTEQLACNLVMRSDGYRRQLVKWARRVAADPTYTDFLDEATSKLVENGAPFGPDEADPGEGRYCWNVDRNLYLLARSIVMHRLGMLDDPDFIALHTHREAGLPAELTVRGLGAQLVQYVADLNNAWAIEVQRLEDGD